MKINSRKPFAYIDPGTGGMIIGSVWSIIAGFLAAIAAFFLSHFIRPLRKFLSKFWMFFKKAATHKSVKFILALVIITIAGYVIINAGMPGEKPMAKKILLIGIDAMDPKICEKLMAEGSLPNFKRLKDEGGYSRLETTTPPETPVAWSAAATGSNPGKYGIFDYIGRDASTYTPKLTVTQESSGLLGTKYKPSLKGVPFWSITSDNGVKTTVIRWPVTFPPEKINGRMLSGLGTVDIKGFLNSYSFYVSGHYEKNKGETGKVIDVSEKDNMIKTSVFGPFVRKGGSLTELEAPMKITIHGDYITIEVDQNMHNVRVGEWSDWIRVKFNVDFLREVSGIFKVYLLSAQPEFRIYATSVQIDPGNPMVDIAYPKEYSKELASNIGLFYTMGMPEDTKAVTEKRITKDIFLEQVKQIENERNRMFWYEFDRFNSGVYAFTFDAGDRLQHLFWSDRVLSGNNSANAFVNSAIRDYYKEKDSFIGEVLDRMDNDTYLIVFSDHGFSSFERSVNINTWLAENGYMALTKDIDENDEGGLFEYVDWSRTKAYSLGFSSIFINLRGREGKGTVDKNESASLVNEIMGKLKTLTDPLTGRRAITNLYASQDIYSGEYASDAPDIIVGFEEGYRMSWQNAVGGFTPEVFANNTQEWTGDHLVDRRHVPGVLFANFGVKKANPNIMDIAPTLLSLLGLKVPEGMEGKSLATG